MQQIKVTIEGPVGAGKTELARALACVLATHGREVEVRDEARPKDGFEGHRMNPTDYAFDIHHPILPPHPAKASFRITVVEAGA